MGKDRGRRRRLHRETMPGAAARSAGSNSAWVTKLTPPAAKGPDAARWPARASRGSASPNEPIARMPSSGAEAITYTQGEESPLKDSDGTALAANPGNLISNRVRALSSERDFVTTWHHRLASPSFTMKKWARNRRKSRHATAASDATAAAQAQLLDTDEQAAMIEAFRLRIASQSQFWRQFVGVLACAAGVLGICMTMLAASPTYAASLISGCGTTLLGAITLVGCWSRSRALAVAVLSALPLAVVWWRNALRTSDDSGRDTVQFATPLGAQLAVQCVLALLAAWGEHSTGSFAQELEELEELRYEFKSA